jgi:hypothetical protein
MPGKTYGESVVMEALIKSTCADWRVDFLSGEA